MELATTIDEALEKAFAGCKLLEINDSATNMVHAVANLELALKDKLEFISNNLYYPSTENTTTTQ